VTPASSPTLRFKLPHSTHIAKFQLKFHVVTFWLLNGYRNRRWESGGWQVLDCSGDAHHVEIARTILRDPRFLVSPQGQTHRALLCSLLASTLARASASMSSALHCITKFPTSITQCCTSVLLRSKPIHCSNLPNSSHSVKSERVWVIRHTFSVQRHVPQSAILLVPFILSKMLQLAGCSDHAEMHNDAFGWGSRFSLRLPWLDARG
jgi:hypothetical protein